VTARALIPFPAPVGGNRRAPSPPVGDDHDRRDPNGAAPYGAVGVGRAVVCERNLALNSKPHFWYASPGKVRVLQLRHSTGSVLNNWRSTAKLYSPLWIAAPLERSYLKMEPFLSTAH